jgi:hypothetical protein
MAGVGRLCAERSAACGSCGSCGSCSSRRATRARVGVYRVARVQAVIDGAALEPFEALEPAAAKWMRAAQLDDFLAALVNQALPAG